MPGGYYPSGWTPVRLDPIAWFRCGRDSVDVNGSTVVAWRSSYKGAPLVGAGTPTLAVNGRGLNKPSIQLDAASSDVLAPSAGEAAKFTGPIDGTDTPFSLFVTFKSSLAAEQNIVCWNSAADANYSGLRFHNDGGSGVLRYSRIGDSASVDVDGNVGIGLTRWWRACVLYDGTNIVMYMDRTQVASAGGGGVGGMNPTTFRVGMGAVMDGITGEIQDVVPIARRCLVAEYIAYYDWSVRTYGYT